MKRREWIGLFLAGLLVGLLAASLERVPGYMDAEYYYAGALRLISGQGGLEPYLWNYLNSPERLPAPAFAYWMPFNSLLAAAGLWFAGPLGFWGARMPFLLLSAGVPLLSALLALRLTGRPAHARLAGLLALFPAFYLPYLTTTDSFPVYMTLGGVFLLLAFADSETRWGRFPLEARLFLLGLLAGLLHLTRADGLLWLAGALDVALAWLERLYKTFPAQKPAERLLHVFRPFLAVLVGYLLIMMPWFARNLNIWGSLLPPGGSRTIWITAYEQTMSYPAALLTPENWLRAGWLLHLSARWEALSNIAQSLVAVQGGVVGLPFMLIGAWKLRGCPEVRLGAGMWLLTAGVMALIFPYAGINGGFFHSSAALQPLLWALAPLGVETLMLGYGRWRKLAHPERLVRFLSTLLVVTGVLLSIMIYIQRVGGSQPEMWGWSASNAHYQTVEKELLRLGAQPGEAVLVNNPPGYWLASGRPALVIANGDEQTQLAIARQFSVRYLVLEDHNPVPMAALYMGQVNPPELEYLTSMGTTRLYRIHLDR